MIKLKTNNRSIILESGGSLKPKFNKKNDFSSFADH